MVQNNFVEQLLHEKKIRSQEKERYHVLENLGEGGMGVVQRVEDRLLGRTIALKKIKIPQQKIMSEKQHLLLWRLSREAEITAVLEHPNIIPLHDMGVREDGEVYFTMREIRGKTLRQLLKESPLSPLSEQALLSIFLKVCDAISYAHSMGVIHRDLKSENIMVGSFGEVYVMDWGIAKKEETSPPLLFEKKPPPSLPTLSESPSGTLFDEDYEGTFYKTIGGLGTPGYMSPEQQRDASQVKPPADIYSLGKVLRECFTRLSPMEELQTQIAQEKTHAEGVFRRKTIFQAHKLFQIPLDIEAIIQKATEKEATKRYASVVEFSAEIERYLQNKRVFARKYQISDLRELLLKWARRNRFWVATFGVVTLLCCLFWIYLRWNQYRIDVAQRKEREEQFSKIYNQVIYHRQEAAEIGVAESKAQQQKIFHLIQSLNALNELMRENPQQSSLKTEKFEIGKQLIQLTLLSQNFQFAYYVATEIAPILEENVKPGLFLQIENEQNKTLREHQKRFQFWIEKAKNMALEEGEREDLLFEISKMPEESIFQQLLALLEEGTHCFLAGQTQYSTTQDFYKLMVTVLGRLENPKAKEPLLKSLQQIEKQVATYSHDRIPVELLQFMITLTHALGNSKCLGVSSYVYDLRWKMGQNGFFWNATQVAYIKLALQDIAHWPAPLTAFDFLKRGLVFFNLKEFEQAIFDFKQAIALDPQFLSAYLNRGLIRFHQQKFGLALQDFNEVIQRDPTHSVAYLNRGTLRFKQGKVAEAIFDYTQAIQLNPREADAYQNRAVAKKMQKDYLGAIDDYTQALALAPNTVKIYLNRGMTKVALGDLEGAISDYQQASQLAPEDPKIYLHRGVAYLQKKEYTPALFDLNKTIELNPQNAEAYHNRGSLKKILKDLPGALLDYNSALQLEATRVETYQARALIYHEQQQWEQAISDYTQAIQYAPNQAELYISRANLYRDQKKWPSAFEDYEEAIRLAPNNALAYVERGTAKLYQDNPKGALSDYTQAIQYEPQNAFYYSNRGNVLLRQGKIEEALSDYQEAIRLNPQHTYAFFYQGICYKKKNELDLAIQSLEQGLLLKQEAKAAQELADILFERALLKYRKKEWIRAKEDLTRFLRYTYPEDPRREKIPQMLKQLEQKMQQQTPK